MSKQDEVTPEQIAESMICGYETDSGVVMGIRRAQIPSLRTLLIEAAKRAMYDDDAPKTLAEARAYRYGEWSGQPRGSAYSEARCAMEVCPSGAWIMRQCNKAKGYGPAGLYCKQHAKRIEPPTATEE